MPPANAEKLWRYADVARLWSWSLILVGIALLGLSILMQAGSDGGLSGGWFAMALGTAAGTAVVLYPLFRVWLRRGSLPSVRLPDARRATGRRHLEASPRDWRRWSVVTAAIMFVASAAVLVFLIGVLGTGGTTEGAVVGLLIAWGVTTLEDARRIRLTEASEGRRYYAQCRRPIGVGNHLVWTRAADA